MENEISGEMTMAAATVAEVESPNREQHDDDEDFAIGGTALGGERGDTTKQGRKHKRARCKQANASVRQHKARRGAH